MTSETPKSNADIALEFCHEWSHELAHLKGECPCTAITKALDDAEERERLKWGHVKLESNKAYERGFERGRQEGLAVAAAFLDEKGLTVLAQHMRSLNAT